MEKRRSDRRFVLGLVVDFVVLVVVLCLMLATAEALCNWAGCPETPSVAHPAYETGLTEEEVAAMLDVCQRGHIDPALARGLHQVEREINMPSVSPAGLTGAERIREEVELLALRLAEQGELEAGLTAYRYERDNGSRWFAAAVLTAAEEFR